jgi:hypothetical protein
MAKIETECSSCSGTGLYRGFAEPVGVGVVCLNCEGTGCRSIEFKPFTGLKRRTDVVTVRVSRGSFILTGVGPAGSSISYPEFLNGKRPQ